MREDEERPEIEKDLMGSRAGGMVARWRNSALPGSCSRGLCGMEEIRPNQWGDGCGLRLGRESLD